MKGMTLDKFMNKIYYGDEIEFKFGKYTYFIQGYKEDGKYTLTVDYWEKADGTEPPHDYILNIKCDSPEERLKYLKLQIYLTARIYIKSKKILQLSTVNYQKFGI